MPPERVFSPPVSPRRGDSNEPTSIERAVGACADGDLDGLLDWLSSGGDVNGSAFGLTLLCAAAENGRLRAVEMLLQRHAIVDACAPDDELSRTALIRACEQRHATCVRSLLDAKASLSHRSGEGFTALDVLRETTKREVLHGLDFVRLMDCTRAITVRMQKDEAMYYDGASVPTPATVVTAEEDRLLDSWAKRVEKERVKLEALVFENSRRRDNLQHEQKLFESINDAHGKSVHDTVQNVTNRLSVKRLQRSPKKTAQEEAQIRMKSQATSMRVSQAAGRFLRPVDAKRAY